MKTTLKGPWSLEAVEKFLGDTRVPLRLAVNASDGFPRVVSLWYRYRSGSLYAVTHKDSAIAAMLRRDPRVGFEVSPNKPPYCGVRGQASVTLSAMQQRDTLIELLQHYLGGVDSRLASWLLSRSEEELLLRIEPVRLYSWDYRERMADIADH